MEKKFAILIVEDQVFMRRTLCEFVQSAHPDAILLKAADGASALEQCRARARIVLMDVTHPDASGIDLTAQIRQMLPETEVIVVSQHDSSVYVERAHAAGEFAYVTKNKIYQQLLPAIDRALGNDRPEAVSIRESRTNKE